MQQVFARHDVRRLRHLVLALSLVACFAPIVEAQGPLRLRERVLSPSKRPVVELEVNGTSFQGYALFSKTPYVLWPADERPEPLFAHDQQAAQRWLDRAGEELGHRDFVPRFEATLNWRGDEVWSYRLQRKGIPLHGSRVMVEWNGGDFVGVVNEVDLPLLAIEEPTADTPRDGSVVYYAERDADGYRAVLRPVHVERKGNLVTTTIGSSTSVVITPAPAPLPVTPRMFDEWNVPPGTSFPDQIDLDANGNVWFSQPSQNYLTRFDPISETFQKFTTTGGSGPDGMTLDANGIVWTGLYYSSTLGRLDPATGIHTTFTMPYSGGNTAIPKPTTLGTLWVTDHNANRVSEFDIANQSWLGSYVIPTAGSWVVEGVEDPVSKTVYFTSYAVNKLAYKPLGQPLLETSTPSGGPSFPVHSQGKIYYSLWSKAELGVYDPVAGTHTTFVFPHAGEVGGPIGATAGGRIVVGTRNVGYIYVFDPATQQFDSYKIPTTSTYLKDGLVVAPDGKVWFTESGANKIARLLIR